MDFPSEYKYADAYVDSGKDDYVGVQPRPEIYTQLTGDPAYESMRSSMASQAGSESFMIPASEYDAKYGMDTRARPGLLNHGVGFDEQLSFAADLLPNPADVVGAALDDYKVGVGYVTSNNKDMPVTGIQTLRPYIPNPASLDGWGSIGIATRGAFGRLGTSDTSSLYLDPRYQEVDYSSASRTVYGFPEIADTASIGVYNESVLPARTSLWGQPGMMQVAGL